MLVGAYVLAGELTARPDDPPAAFAAYQRAMQAYVEACTKLPPGGSRLRLAEPHDDPDPDADGVDALDDVLADARDP